MRNPYEPPTRTPRSKAQPRWVLRFFVLNLSLLAVPASIALMLYAWAEIAIAMESLKNRGDPVLYEHSYRFSFLSPWALAEYLSIPNAILAAIYLYHRCSASRKAGVD